MIVGWWGWGRGGGGREGDVLFSVHISLSFKVDVVVSVGFDINVGVGMEFFSLRYGSLHRRPSCTISKCNISAACWQISTEFYM